MCVAFFKASKHSAMLRLTMRSNELSVRGGLTPCLCLCLPLPDGNTIAPLGTSRSIRPWHHSAPKICLLDLLLLPMSRLAIPDEEAE
jgi:hypothetical protein